MSERPPTNDLRLRMQRVAIKPVTKRPAPARPHSAAADRRPEVAPSVTVEATKALDSRFQTLLAWARWELAVVPEERWRWLMAVTRRGGDASRHQRLLKTRRARGN
jgi:preprotein translocase subunit SecB